MNNNAKQSKVRKKQALAVQTPQKMDSQVKAMKKMAAREELLIKLAQHACRVTGTGSRDVAFHLIVQASSALVSPNPADDVERIVVGYAVMAEMAPRNATEAMLATQMIAVNDAALLFLGDATRQRQYPAVADASARRATRLMRIFTEQLEAMQRLKGKACQQRVTVEHVHVHEGGQAIVGAVTAAGTGGREGGGDGETSGNTP